MATLNSTRFETLLKAAQAGNKKACNELIKANEGLIGDVLKNMSYISEEIREDLFQAGRIGLLNAINNFDLKKNCRFSTYAVPCIKQMISDEIFETNRVFSVSKDTSRKINKAKKLFNGCDKSMSLDEKLNYVATALNCTKKTVEDYLSTILESSSFEGLLENDDGEKSNSKYEMDLNFVSPDTEFFKNKDTCLVQAALEKLKAHDLDAYNVVTMHYGFVNEKELSFSDVGKILNTSKQNACNWNKNGLEFLRTCKEMQDAAMPNAA